MTATRRLAAIFAADVAGFARLIEADEAGTLARLGAVRQIMDGLIDARDGGIANTAGDSVLAEFPSAHDATVAKAEADRKKRDESGGG